MFNLQFNFALQQFNFQFKQIFQVQVLLVTFYSISILISRVRASSVPNPSDIAHNHHHFVSRKFLLTIMICINNNSTCQFLISHQIPITNFCLKNILHSVLPLYFFRQSNCLMNCRFQNKRDDLVALHQNKKN